MGTNIVTVGAEAAKLAGLQIDLLQKMRDGQRTIEHFEWFLGLRKDECDKFVIKANSIIDNCFKLVNTFPLTVPEDYDHATCLDSFRKLKNDQVAHMFDFYRHSDAEFSDVTTKLVPGLRFKVKVFQVKELVSCEECLVLLESEKAVLTGVQGLVLAYQLAKDQFPLVGDDSVISRGTDFVSLDKKTSFRANEYSGQRSVPSIGIRWGSGIISGSIIKVREFSSGSHVYFDSCLGTGFCILCFCDLPSGE